MLERFFSGGALEAGGHVGFFSGVGMLLPVVGKAWELQIKPWFYSPYGFYIALGLIVLSVLIIGFVSGSVSKLLRSVGLMLIIPGIIAIIFAAFGEFQVYTWAQNQITGFTVVQPAVKVILDHSVPQTAILGGFYIIIGGCISWIGNKLARFADYI